MHILEINRKYLFELAKNKKRDHKAMFFVADSCINKVIGRIRRFWIMDSKYGQRSCVAD